MSAVSEFTPEELLELKKFDAEIESEQDKWDPEEVRQARERDAIARAEGIDPALARRRAYYKTWRAKHKDRIAAQDRAYYAKNKDAILARNRKWRQEHIDQDRERQKAYRASHKEQTKERQKRWRDKKKAERLAVQ